MPCRALVSKNRDLNRGCFTQLVNRSTTPRRGPLHRAYDATTLPALLSYRLLYVARRPPPRRREMLLPGLAPLLDSALEIVAAGGSAAGDAVPLLPHAGACVFSLFAGVEGAEVPHNESLHQKHREGCDQSGPRPAGQPASTGAADHVRTPRCTELEERLLL
ncbi:hypothetical protein AMECASPLE_012585 [Ameca splendens]|uniref:Uncharacterized protein n=1 Tax=Ameca splendens TaxID=208324 RepID=A0ABV0Y116_9TELE